MRQVALMGNVENAAGSPPASEPPEDDALVLAMPRRELFKISGFTAQIDLAILDCLAEESWYARPASLIGNLDAKEVRIALVVERGGEVLVDAGGALVQTAAIPPEISRLGSGVRALREFALAAGRTMLGASCRVELAGYCNEDALAEVRHCFILVYRCRTADDCPAPAGAAWEDRQRLGGIALDPLSALVAGALYPQRG